MISNRLRSTCFAALLSLAAGCSDNGSTISAGTGGAPTAGSGGTIATGGVSSAGGTVASGGAVSSGGAVGSGGRIGSGGKPETGGAVSTGGDVGSGGAIGTGGAGKNGTGGGVGRDGGPDFPGSSGGAGPGGGPGTGGSGAGGSTSGGSDPHEPGNAPVPSAGCSKTPTLKSGTQTITSAGLSRQFIIDIPADYDNKKPYRLIFGFHWMGGTMTDVATGQTVTKNTWSYFGLKPLDTPRSAIFVAPQGIDNGWANTNGRDLTFTDDMVKMITDDLCVDKSRVFSGGFSYGGMWSSTLACQRPDVFRALAPQNGSGSCSSPKKVAFFASGSKDGTNQSLQTYARTFAKVNGCADPNQAMPLPTAGSHLHTCTSFTGCPAAYPVRFCAFDQNHKAAPCDGCTDEQDNGNTTWTPAEVWKFYTQF